MHIEDTGEQLSQFEIVRADGEPFDDDASATAYYAETWEKAIEEAGQILIAKRESDRLQVQWWRERGCDAAAEAIETAARADQFSELIVRETVVVRRVSVTIGNEGDPKLGIEELMI